MTTAQDRLLEIEFLIKTHEEMTSNHANCNCREYKAEYKGILLGQQDNEFIVKQLETKLASMLKRDEEIKVFVDEWYNDSMNSQGLKEHIRDMVSRAERPTEQGGYQIDTIVGFILDTFYIFSHHIKTDAQKWKKEFEEKVTQNAK